MTTPPIPWSALDKNPMAEPNSKAILWIKAQHEGILKNIYLAALGLSCGMQAYLLQGMWNLGSLTRDQTGVPCIARRILNLRTIRGVPLLLL